MEKRRDLWTALALFALTAALYWPATGFQFVAFDDGLYVSENPLVQAGLTLAALKGAATAVVAANWHPLTLLSLMLDRSLFGPGPAGFHLANLVLHAANAALLFIVLRRLTNSYWPAALAAALFGWHPLNVESVAWVAERKNVLSTLFLLLALWCYAHYARRKTVAAYAGALVCFALGLLAKPMLVSLPLILLLLDYWPLGRFYAAGGRTAPMAIGTVSDSKISRLSGPGSAATPADFGSEQRSQRAKGQARIGEVIFSRSLRLIVEKLPFIFLSLIFCIVTLAAQAGGHGVKSTSEVPLGLRAANIPVACAAYLARTFWPANLCVYYPLPAGWPVYSALGSLALLAAVSALAFHRRRRFPWLTAGWLWFLVTLLPVIGIVQVGSQASADRYVYVPELGLFLALAWSLERWCLARPGARAWITGACAAVLLGCLGATHAQLQYWRDSVSLFTRAVSVTRNNGFMQDNLGVVYSLAGNPAAAIAQFEAATRSNPEWVEPHYHLGQALMSAGQYPEAEAQFLIACQEVAPNAVLLNNLGVARAMLDKPSQARDSFLQARQLDPGYAKSYFNLALLDEKAGHYGEAATNYLTAVRLDPDWPEALNRLALFQAAGPEGPWRDPANALASAARANQLTARRVPAFLETQAACEAANGSFSNAVALAVLAEQTAREAHFDSLAGQLARQIKIYEAGRMPTNFTSAPSLTTGPPAITSPK
jgi:tetratricopeptide (TPR) repeat protein